MKYFIIQKKKNTFLKQLLCIAVIQVLLVTGLYAQADSTAKKEEGKTEEAAVLISPTLQFITVQKADNTIDLKAVLKAKIKGSFIKLPLLKIKFTAVNGDAENDLGFKITDREGKAVLNIKADSLVMDKEGKVHFKALFTGNKAMEAATEEAAVKRARLEITPVKDDSVFTVKAKLVDLGSGKETPVPEITVGIFVKRSFNALKLGEGATDTNGEASVEIPANLPGDAQGNITLIGRLDENETYGNLEAASVQKWGIPVSDKLQELPRALWSSHPPLWMLFTFIILISVVWGHYIVIIFQLFRLRKEEPHNINTADAAVS